MFYIGNMADFNVFSLEDDDVGDMFITQTPSVNDGEVGESEKVEDLMEFSDKSQMGLQCNDFSSPCVSLLSKKKIEGAVYSDISDDDFDIPSSQLRQNDR